MFDPGTTSLQFKVGWVMIGQAPSGETDFFWFVFIFNVTLFLLVVISISAWYSRREPRRNAPVPYGFPFLAGLASHWVEMATGLILAIMAAGFVNLFTEIRGVAVAFIITFVVSSCMIYLYPEIRIWAGLASIVLGAGCLAIPIDFFLLGRVIFGTLGVIGAVTIATVMLPLGVFLLSIGFWFLSQALRKTRAEWGASAI